MRLAAWHMIRAVTAALVVAALALMPVAGNALTSPTHMVASHAVCSGELQSGTAASHHMALVGSAQKNDCGRFSGQKDNCCLGTTCSSVQMAELPSMTLPTPGAMASVMRVSSTTTVSGLHPAPSPKPPRLVI